MKTSIEYLFLLPALIAGLGLAGATSALAEVHYVDVNSTNATPPYTNWATAATNIQDAVDAAVAGDEVVVTNGTYATGERNGNRAKVDKPVRIRSVNGSQFTTIDGGNSLRCVYLTNNASLTGFTLTNGFDFDKGGGVFCDSTNAAVTKCVIAGNVVGSIYAFQSMYGGGAYGGTLDNCTLAGNSVQAIIGYASVSGGGAAYCTLNNCVLTGNSARGGGGAYACALNNCNLSGNSAVEGGGASAATLNNCIVYFNVATNGANYDGFSTLNFSCSSPQPTNGFGNITNAPLFVDTNGWADLHLQFNSPCINAGNNAYAVGATDLDGNPRINRATVDIGAYEFQSTTRYVDLNSTNATAPYTNWVTAAINIQNAVDAAVAGDEVVVTNGLYFPVTVNKPLNVRSVNGPQFTVINGGGAYRCAYLTNNASISGFTLTNGYALQGGGARCESQTAVLSDCVITGNRASAGELDFYGRAWGGGAYGGTLNNCTVMGNAVDTAAFGDNNLVYAYGGGAAFCVLNNCTVIGNVARASNGNWHQAYAYAYGGGAYGSMVNNCTLTSNSAFYEGSSLGGAYGGGASDCNMFNCTLTGNFTLPYYASVQGGGVYRGTLYNCILFNNRQHGTCDYCGSPGGLAGNNWLGDPLFADTKLRLQSNSPCINAGNNALAPAGPDLDGNPRIAGGTVDIGAYELQAPASQISYAWLQHYGLPLNAATDTADPDGDAVDTYHEWLAFTDPTNPLSSPAQLTITLSETNLLLTWPTNAVGFTLQSTTNLVSPSAWTTNSPAPIVLGDQNVVTNSLSGPQQFFRLVH